MNYRSAVPWTIWKNEVDNAQFKKKGEDNLDMNDGNANLRIKIEKFAIIGLGCFAWIMLVRAALSYLQFPVHLHKTEVLLIYIIPIAIIFLLIHILDSLFPS